MSITSDQVVHSLMAYYKSRGIDTTFLLGDPVFMTQPIDVKVRFLKEKAGELATGTVPGYTSSEKAAIGSSALAGAVSGLLGAKTIMHGADMAGPYGRSAYFGTLVLGALGGAWVGGAAGHAGAAIRRDSRKGIADQIHATARDPSDMNAVGLLSIGARPNFEGPSFKELLLDRVKDRMESSDIQESMKINSKKTFHNLGGTYQE